jgi:HEAT repeat protein
MHDGGNVPDGPRRRRLAALAGHRGDATAARAALGDADPAVRATALAAAARAGGLAAWDVGAALADPDPAVRRRACEVVAAGAPGTAEDVLGRLDDEDPSVVEVAAWALGELGERGVIAAGTIAGLSRIATGHGDPLAREAAVAALGALGDPEGLDAILAATADKPAVRRRAVLALAPFDGPAVDEALARAADDRDWQVREAAAWLRRG